MTTSDLPAEGQPDVSAEGTEAPFDDVITLSTSTDEDGVVTVTVVGEVDTFTAPVLRSTLDSWSSSRGARHRPLRRPVPRLRRTGRARRDAEVLPLARGRPAADRQHPRGHPPLEVTGLIDLFTIADSTAR